MDKTSLAEMAGKSHLWALRRARSAVRGSLSRLDKSLPELAERRLLEVPGAAAALEARLYRPVGVPENAPLLLYFHGGGFVVSDLDTHEPLCIRLAQAGRLRVLSARYRLAPESRFPAQLDDALSVTRWLAGEGADIVGSARSFAIGGDSAGAYLAISAAARIHRESLGAIKAQLLLYPLLQLDETQWAKDLLKQTRVIGWAAVRYINMQLAAPGGGAPSLLSLSQTAPLPCLIAAGGVLDPCRDDAVRLADILRDAGREVVWRDYPTLVHGFGSLTHLSGAARRAVAEVGELFGGLLAE